MARFGLEIGFGILLLVIVCGFLLARKAARSVREFREEQHERFKGPAA